MDGLMVGTSSLVAPPGIYGEAVDCDLKFTTTGDSTWYTTTSANAEYYYDGDAVYSGETSYEEEAWLQTIVDSDSAETFKFYWKVSCQTDYDYLEFYIDNQLQDSITGEVDWTLKSYSISAGPHTLKWRYIDGGGDSGSNCGIFGDILLISSRMFWGQVCIAYSVKRRGIL